MQGNEIRNPYAVATPSLDLTPAYPYEAGGEKAGRLGRLLANLADGLVALLCVLPLLLLLGVGAMMDASKDTASMLLAIGGLIAAVAVLGVFIYNLILLSREGQTIGKRWIGIRIVRNDGSQAGLGRIFWMRMFAPALVGVIPFLGSIFGLANVLWIFGDEKRCLHDLMADTIVVIA